jgi:hypothetical protein
VTLCPTTAWGFSHTERPGLRKTRTPLKKWPGVHHCEKLLEIGRYLNKGYQVFIDTYFMSVTLVHHLHRLSAYITGTVWRNRKLLAQHFKYKFAVGQKMYCRSSPLLSCVFHEKKKKNLVILLSIHATTQEEKYGEDMVAIHR